jgi:hypothetical protein
MADMCQGIASNLGHMSMLESWLINVLMTSQPVSDSAHDHGKTLGLANRGAA